jgi:sugar lactone lactonase YvrE
VRVIEVELVLDARASTAERPVWDEGRRRLLWVDVPAGEVHRLDPATGRDETLLKLDQPVGCACLREGGGLALGDRDGFALFDEGAREPSARFPVERPNETVRMNDGLCDPAGRYLAGTLDAQGAGGALYRLEAGPGGCRVERLIGGVRESNGLDWSPDGSLLYWTDTATGRVDVLDYDVASGRLAQRRPFVEVPPSEGVPDGLIVDAEGGVWVAVYGGGVVRRYDPAGRADLEVRLPVRRPTCPTFGGPDLGDLFVTSQRVSPEDPGYRDDPRAGGIFGCRPGVLGRPARRFAG